MIVRVRVGELMKHRLHKLHKLHNVDLLGSIRTRSCQ